ncbi:MAG: hypothetical protein GX987_01930 [Tissierellia bacterium]|nr:hypothetical protein [Tissierellia bacterium]
MIITKIEPQRNKKRVNIYIDGEFAFGILKEIQYKYKLWENTEIDRNYIEDILIAEQQAKANDYALRFISYRQRSKKEIQDKLTKEGFDNKFIENTIAYLESHRLIDDLEFAKSFARDKINLNKYGPQKIKYELYKKGISDEIIDEVLDEDDTEYTRALKLAKKKLPTYKKDDKNGKYRKLGGFLQRRGYSSDCVYKILKELVK